MEFLVGPPLAEFVRNTLIMPPPTSALLMRRRITVVVLVVGIAALFAAITHFGGGDHWKEWMQTMPLLPLLVCFALLPLTGFPLTLLLLAVGARLGFWPGLAATAVVTVIHLVASYPLAGRVRRPVTALLSKAGWRLPQLDREAAWPFSAWLALAPGLSYALKNYTPPLAGVPFTIYFATYFPIHMVTSVLGLLLGGATMNFSWPMAAGVLVYAIIMGTLTKILADRLRKRSKAATNATEVPVDSASTHTA